MKKLIAVLTTGIFLMTLLVPVASLAGEEIQLAQAIGSSNNSRTEGGAITGAGATPGTIGAGTGTALSTTGVAIAVGVGVAGLIAATRDTKSTSNH